VEAAAHPGGWQPIPLELPHVTAPIYCTVLGMYSYADPVPIQLCYR
jgi:hypothetical protein